VTEIKKINCLYEHRCHAVNLDNGIAELERVEKHGQCWTQGNVLSREVVPVIRRIVQTSRQ